MNQYRKEKNWLEWCVFSGGLILVAAIVGYLAYDLWTAPSGPPRVDVRLGEASERSGRYYVPVSVKNDGHEVAERVEIEVELKQINGQAEKAGFTVQFLPRGATRRGTVTFTNDPRLAEELTAQVRGYQQP